MAPKDKKLFGILDLFRKKTSSEVNKESIMRNSIESFSEINELIPSQKLTYRSNITGTSKSTKSFAAPAPPLSAENINKKVKDNCDATPVEMHGEQSIGNSPDKLSIVKDRDHWNDKQDKGNAVQSPKKESRRNDSFSSMTSSVFLETEVIHYSPHGTIRRATHSPDPISDVPSIERRSNVILKDPNRLKSIPVTRYDGSSKQETPSPENFKLSEKNKHSIFPDRVEDITAVDVIPVSTISKIQSYSAYVSSETTVPYSYNKETNHKVEVTSSQKMFQQEPVSISNLSQPISTREAKEVIQQTKCEMEDDQIAAEITSRYEDLKAKFDIWQALQVTNKHLPETKKLHMELIRDHDSLMRQLQLAKRKDSSPAEIGIGKRRQSITPDLFTSKSPVGIRPISNSSPALPHRSSLSLKNIRYPTSTGSSSSHTSSPSSSRSGTPKLSHSSSSLSPTASITSDDGGRPVSYRHLECRGKLGVIAQQKVDENSNEVIRAVMKKGASVTKISEKRDDERKRATNRILEEARELKRKEDELRKKSTIEFNQNGQIILDDVPTRKKKEAGSTIWEATQTKGQPNHPTTKETPGLKINNSENSPKKTEIIEKQNNREQMRKSENIRSLKTLESYENRNRSLEAKTALIPQMSQYSTCHHKPSLSYDFSPTKTNEGTVALKYNRQKIPMNQHNGKLVISPLPKASSCQNKVSHQEIPKLNKPIISTQIRTLIEDARTVSKQHQKVTPSEEGIKTVEGKETTQSSLPIAKAKIDNKLTEVEYTKVPISTECSTKNTTNVEQTAPLRSKKVINQRDVVINNIEEGLSTLRKVAVPVEKNGIQLGKVIDSPLDLKTPISPVSSSSNRSSVPIPPPPPPPMGLLPNISRHNLHDASNATYKPTSSTKISLSMEQLNEQKLKLKPAPLNDKPACISQDIRECLLDEIRNSGGIKNLKKVQSLTKT